MNTHPLESSRCATARITSDTPSASVLALRAASRTLRKGDHLSQWEATISHRYAGTIAEFDTPANAETAMRKAGYKLIDRSPFLPIIRWQVA